MSGLESGDLLGGDTRSDAIVRAARRGDAAAITAIQARAWQRFYADVLGPRALATLGTPEAAQVWHDAIVAPPTPAHRVVVATTGSNVVGFAAVAGIEIAALVVEPVHHRRGHGSRLLAAVVAALKDDNRSRVQTWVLAQDRPLLDFYAGAGMTPDGAQRIYEAGTEGGTQDLTELRISARLD